MGKRERAFGNARQLPSGRWQVRYWGPDGRRYSAPMTFVKETDANRWLRLKEAEVARGEWISPDQTKITVKEWGDRWFASVSPTLKPKTRASYESLMRTLVVPQFGNVELSLIRPIMIGEWIASLTKRGLSASRIRQAYVLLSQIMTSAVGNEIIKASPCKGIKLPRLPQTEPHILTEEEIKRLIDAISKPHDVIVKLLAYGGLRIGEAFALRRRHVDLETGRLTVAESLSEIAGRHVFVPPKSHEKREIALPAFVLDALRDHLASMEDRPDVLLFRGKRGNPYHYNSWRRAYFNPAVKAAKLSDVTPHDLRASHATWVADRHGVMAAARRLGHSNASVTTRHYARAVEGRDREIAELLDAVSGYGEDQGTGRARAARKIIFRQSIKRPTRHNGESGSSDA